MEFYPENGPREDQGEIDFRLTCLLLLTLVLRITCFEWSLVLPVKAAETISCLRGVNAFLKLHTLLELSSSVLDL